MGRRFICPDEKTVGDVLDGDQRERLLALINQPEDGDE